MKHLAMSAKLYQVKTIKVGVWPKADSIFNQLAAN